MWITRTSIRNPVFATMVMIGITVLGVFSYLRLNVEQMPDVSLPFVQIMTLWSHLMHVTLQACEPSVFLIPFGQAR